jgi:hypothetical protein
VFHRTAKSFHEEAGFFFWIEDVEFLNVRIGSDRLWQIWPLVFEFQREAHSLCRDENVGEDDDGVNIEATQGLDGNFEGQIGGLADLEERVFCADFTVFREVAACLAHHPDGKTGNRFAAAGAKEKLFTRKCGRMEGHKYGSRIANWWESCLCGSARNWHKYSCKAGRAAFGGFSEILGDGDKNGMACGDAMLRGVGVGYTARIGENAETGQVALLLMPGSAWTCR